MLNCTGIYVKTRLNIRWLIISFQRNWETAIGTINMITIFKNIIQVGGL